MATRVCYIHIGPHKTGTSAIQWFLKEHRAELLRQGYFVPESGTAHGGHHPLARTLCGQAVPDHQQLASVQFARAIAETPCEAVVVSSEALDTLLRNSDCAIAFFNRIEELNLEPKLVLFPRNQSQSINSRYMEVVKGFQFSESFEAFVQKNIRCPGHAYSPLIELAKAFHADLIPRPFTVETVMGGVVPEFLCAIGIDPSPFSNTYIRRNQSVGPFTVSVARHLLRLILNSGKQLKWLQTVRCKKRLIAYLHENGLADTGYCGLTTPLARHIENEWCSDNDAFAQRVWGRPWTEMFAADVGGEFNPNDFDMSEPDESTDLQLCRAVKEMTATVEEIMRDATLAIDATWNDLRQRCG
ncbi:MAG: hypothetical protein DME65_07200 [Verrucomicrobia bacterium]|nr:MAG: hypothetical protein DME65_07200 [Verrucomicrobiota bacterium]